jgi:hypothetical protein
LAQRKKRIERDVQESVEVVHSIVSKDITRAELSLHEKYKEQRRWGEWFDLSDGQVAEICALNRIDY